jgi:hypothetical protein
MMRTKAEIEADIRHENLILKIEVVVCGSIVGAYLYFVWPYL